MRRFLSYFYANSWLAAGLLVLAGAVISWGMLLRVDQQMRADFLDQTRLFSQTFHNEQIKTLSGSAADLSAPVYQEFKREFSAIQKANPRYRFLYLMGRKQDGSIFFFADSEASTSPDYSPPGQIYSEAPEEIKIVFDQHVPTVIGPISDRWGTWISALMPLIDPLNGQILAVARIDIPVSSWYLELASRVALPAGLALVILIGLGMAFYVFKPELKDPTRPILNRLLPPIALVMIFLVVFTETLFWQMQTQALNEQIAGQVADVSLNLHTALEQQTSALVMLAQPLAASPGVQSALLAQDAARLTADWQPLFAQLQQESGLGHAGFLDAQGHCLVHFDSPQACADQVDGHAVWDGLALDQPVSGLELDSLGRFWLWLRQPVFAQGRLVGYLEMGKDIEAILKSVSSQTASQLALVINKQYLDQAKWEAGLRSLGQQPDWMRLANGVVAYSSMGKLPDTIVTWADGLAGEMFTDSPQQDITSNGQSWRVAALPMRDALGREVGNLLVMVDISVKQADVIRGTSLAETASFIASRSSCRKAICSFILFF
ncbi:MAG: hypothetical protein NTW32_20215 [Chloroflexi bacterium]|nr:hypothetical protein [Chloroflexota bacterium]